jgi:hypothetical protein
MLIAMNERKELRHGRFHSEKVKSSPSISLSDIGLTKDESSNAQALARVVIPGRAAYSPVR